MTHQTGLVACIKVAGQVLRETQDSVLLPFGSEYSILIKNLKSRRMLVKVSVDGVDATEGTSLVVAANSEIELERFIRSGNLTAGNRFKFIERTDAIEKHRGIKADDGLVRIEYWTERVDRVEHVRTIRHDEYVPYYPPWPYRPWPYYPRWPFHEPVITWTTSCSRSTGSAIGGLSNAQYTYTSGQNVGQVNTVNCCYTGDAGITVPGSESNQMFVAASSFQTDPQSEVLVLRLRGQVGGKPVPRPITVKTKLVCSTCGKHNRSKEKFCPACGTAVMLV